MYIIPESLSKKMLTKLQQLVHVSYTLHIHAVTLDIIIIILTNEKIKLMLSRKCCRGTLQDYNKGEISKCQSKLWTNRNVFSWCLNGTREETVRSDGGISL